jgi:aspartate racemase
MITFNDKKKLGVLGGLGPQATSFFMDRVIEHTNASCDQEHIDMIILNHASTPDRTKAILSGDSEELLRSMIEDVRTLEQLGVANIAIPCNTSHYYYEKLQAETKVPIIHMVRESVRYAQKQFGNVKKIGIMATDGTISSGIYRRECEKAGITAVNPSEERQKDVMHIIYDEIKAGERGSRHLFHSVVDELMTQGCDAIILGCTELSVYKEYHSVPDICLDAMDILVRESIQRSGATYV